MILLSLIDIEKHGPYILKFKPTFQEANKFFFFLPCPPHYNVVTTPWNTSSNAKDAIFFTIFSITTNMVCCD